MTILTGRRKKEVVRIGIVILALVLVCVTIQPFSLFRTRRLVHSIKSGNRTAAEAWLERGADPNLSDIPSNILWKLFVMVPSENYGKPTPLEYACEAQDPDMVRFLLQYGAEPDYDVFGELIFHWSDHSEELIVLLLENGGWASLCDDIHSHNDNTHKGQYLVEQLVRMSGDALFVFTDIRPDVDAINRCVAAFLEYGKDELTTDGSLLYYAAEAHNTELVMYLLDSGLPTDYQDEAGRTAENLAAEKGYDDIVRLFNQ